MIIIARHLTFEEWLLQAKDEVFEKCLDCDGTAVRRCMECTYGSCVCDCGVKHDCGYCNGTEVIACKYCKGRGGTAFDAYKDQLRADKFKIINHSDRIKEGA